MDEESKHMTAKSWPSIKHLILSGFFLPPVCVAMSWKEFTATLSKKPLMYVQRQILLKNATCFVYNSHPL
jgi:hypothetical protein